MEYYLIFVPVVPVVIILLIVIIKPLKKKEQLVDYAEKTSEHKNIFVVDVDSALLFRGNIRNSEDIPYTMVLDTETCDVIKTNENFESTVSLPIAISWILLDNKLKFISEKSYILNQEVTVTHDATVIHGITNQDVKNKGESPNLVIKELLSDLAKIRVIAAHNINFHYDVLRLQFLQVGIDPNVFESKISFCTMCWSAKYSYPISQIHTNRYQTLSELFGSLVLGNPRVMIKYTNKSLRDVRLVMVCLRYIKHFKGLTQR